MAQAEIGALRVRLAMDAAEFSRGADRIRSDLDRLASKMARFGDEMNRIGLTMSAAITAPLAALGALATRSAMAFETGMGNIATIVDTSAESMAAMSKEVLALSKDLPVGLADLTTALYDIRSAGIASGDAMSVLDKSAKLAVAGLGTVQQSADIASSAINAFGLEGAAVQKMFSDIFATTQFGKTTIAQLSQGFGAVAGTVAQAGVKLDEYLASVAALTTTGLPAAEAHTQLRGAIAGLTRESEIGKKVLHTLGAETFKDLIAQSGGLVGAFEKIRATLQSNDANLIKLLGSQEAYNAVIGLTGKQGAVFRASLESMRAGVDGLETAFGKQADTAAAKWALLMNAFERVKIAVGNILLPAMESLAGWLEQLAASFAELSPETQRLVVIAAALAAAIGPVVAGIGLLVTGLGAIVPVIAAVGTTIAAFIATSGPLGLFVVMATTLTSAWQIWGDDIVALFGRVTAYIGEQVGWMLEKLGALKTALTGMFGGEVEAGAAAIAETLGKTATPAVQQLADAFANVELQMGGTVLMYGELARKATESVPITDLATAATQRHSEAQRMLNQLMREGRQVIEDTRTPQEELIARQQKLSALLMAEAIGAETYGRAMQKASLVALNAYAGMASGIAGNLSQVFEDSKGVAIAAALINTAESVTKTLATYGATPWGLAAAAAAAAAGMAQVANIRKTTKSGGGGGAGDGGVSAAAAAPSPQQGLFIQLNGETFGREQVRGLIEQIQGAIDDGATLRLSRA